MLRIKLPSTGVHVVTNKVLKGACMYVSPTVLLFSTGDRCSLTAAAIVLHLNRASPLPP